MEIKIDIKGSSVELEAFLHILTINHSQKEKTAVKTANTKKKGRPKKAQKTAPEPARRTTPWMIRKWPTSETTFSRRISK